MVLFSSSKFSQEKWDLRFLKLAYEISLWSHDPSRRIGAVIVRDRRILATGYNGFPRSIEDRPERWNFREEKYKYVVHGEMNAIYNAIHHGISLTGATLYVIGLPVCGECAKGIIQVGITRVVIPQQDVPDSWGASCALTIDLFKEAEVAYEKVKYEN